MPVKRKILHIIKELQRHIPFTALGAVAGIVFMFLFRSLSSTGTHRLFIIFHPAHVVLSAMVTTSMFRMHTIKKNFFIVLIVGYFGSIGIATLSDIIIPQIGSDLLGLESPSHADLHKHETPENHTEAEYSSEKHTGETEHTGIHLGFIEDWYIVNPAAILGVLIAYLIPGTKFPHAGHVLIGTWASSSYLLMNMQAELGIAAMAGIFLTLFMSTWLPCCISDIIFPLLFVKDPDKLKNHN
jgi:hypothetical protein